HWPPRQSALAAHFFPAVQGAQSVPPQSLSVSTPFCAPSVQVGTWQVAGLPEHTALAQSPATTQSRPSVQGRQEPPPQSTSVSVPSRSVSLQPAVTQALAVQMPLAQSVPARQATHWPAPSQSLPTPTLHTVPEAEGGLL